MAMAAGIHIGIPNLVNLNIGGNGSAAAVTHCAAGEVEVTIGTGAVVCVTVLPILASAGCPTGSEVAIVVPGTAAVCVVVQPT